jgi:hypothetical protein
MPLDLDKKYLIQEGSNAIYVHTEVLAKRKDMKPYDPVREEAVSDLKTPAIPKESIEIRGITYQVEQGLHEVLSELVEYIESLKSENRMAADYVKSLELELELLKDEKKIREAPPTLIDPRPEEANPAGDQNDQPETKPKPGRPRKPINK